MKRAPSRFIVKKYTTKEWKRFSPNIQAELSRRYTVVLTDYKTRQEKIKNMKSKFKAGLKTMDSKISKMEIGGSGKSINYLDAPINIKSPNTLGMFDSGFGKKKSSYFDSLAKF